MSSPIECYSSRKCGSDYLGTIPLNLTITNPSTFPAFKGTKAIDAIDVSGDGSLEFGECLSKCISCTCDSNCAVHVQM
jgi:hypothetical protein